MPGGGAFATIMSEIIPVHCEEDCRDAGARAASVLNQGGLVAFPTETVYGVGARADHREALHRLRTLKARPDGQPFTVHIADPSRVRDYVPNLTDLGRRLVRKGWPGPLTLLFRVPDPVCTPALEDRDAALATEIYHAGEIGLRCPDHDVARGMLAGVTGPVIAASANRVGRAPACDASAAMVELGDGIDLLLDAGPAKFGMPSTVVRVGENEYEVVREGVWNARTLRRLASMDFLFICTGNTCRSPMAAGLFRHRLAARLGCAVSELADHRVCVGSAGTSAADGSKVSPEAVTVMRRRGVDISDHRARRVNPELIDQADCIYVMTRSHAGAVAAAVPSAEAKTKLLSDDGDIEDPIGGGVSVYESCAANIEKALTKRLGEVRL